MTAEEGRGSDRQSDPRHATRTQAKRSQPENQPIFEAQVRTPATRSSQEEQLLSEQEILSNQGLGSGRPEEECGQAPEKRPKNLKDVVHSG